MKVPDVKRCCFCFPLRWGIVMFAIINMMLSILTMGRLVVVTKHFETSSTGNYYLEVLNSTLFLILAGGIVLLSLLLLVGGYQKDASLLRLYNVYSIALVGIIIIQTVILLWRAQYHEAGFTFFIIVIQVYLILVVRSDIIKLETTQESEGTSTDSVIEVPDRVTLL